MVNRKWVHRLWRTAQLQVPNRHRRRRRAGGSAATPMQATYPGQVWSYDFVRDACLTGTKLKLVPVVDEFTRECLAIEVATTLSATRVIGVLDRLFAAHRALAYLRSDNGPEFVAHSWPRRFRAGSRRIMPSRSTSSPAASGRITLGRASTAHCVTSV